MMELWLDTASRTSGGAVVENNASWEQPRLSFEAGEVLRRIAGDVPGVVEVLLVVKFPMMGPLGSASYPKISSIQ